MVALFSGSNLTTPAKLHSTVTPSTFSIIRSASQSLPHASLLPPFLLSLPPFLLSLPPYLSLPSLPPPSPLSSLPSSLRCTTKPNRSNSSDNSSPASTQSASDDSDVPPATNSSTATSVVYSVPSCDVTGPHSQPSQHKKEHIYDEPYADCDKVCWPNTAHSRIQC